jgi:hypothetical protein
MLITADTGSPQVDAEAGGVAVREATDARSSTELSA